MSGYDSHHFLTPKELLEGLAEAYRRELKRKMSARARQASREPEPQPRGADFPSAAKDSLARILGAVLLLRVDQLALIFLAVTTLTLVLSSIAVLL